MSRVLILCALAAALGSCASQPDPRIDTIQSYRNARNAGDHAAARAVLVEKPRVWFDSREGAGSPLNLEGKGPWREWDEYFGSTGTDIAWECGSNFVSVIRAETNDYFRLIESGGSQYRITYFFDDRGKIEGYMVSAWEGAAPNADRADEFAAWAQSHYPEEWAYLRPNGRIDPTEDRPQRTRALANRWRHSVGLAPIGAPTGDSP